MAKDYSWWIFYEELVATQRLIQQKTRARFRAELCVRYRRFFFENTTHTVKLRHKRR